MVIPDARELLAGIVMLKAGSRKGVCMDRVHHGRLGVLSQTGFSPLELAYRVGAAQHTLRHRLMRQLAKHPIACFDP